MLLIPLRYVFFIIKYIHYNANCCNIENLASIRNKTNIIYGISKFPQNHFYKTKKKFKVS